MLLQVAACWARRQAGTRTGSSPFTWLVADLPNHHSFFLHPPGCRRAILRQLLTTSGLWMPWFQWQTRACFTRWVGGASLSAAQLWCLSSSLHRSCTLRRGTACELLVLPAWLPPTTAPASRCDFPLLPSLLLHSVLCQAALAALHSCAGQLPQGQPMHRLKVPSLLPTCTNRCT